MLLQPIETIKARVGTELGVSEWLLIDQARIDAFADATEDHNDIHVDAQAGRAAGLGGTIAHGFLTLSMLLKLSEDVIPLPEGLTSGFNYGMDRVRFISPVRSGKRIRGRFALLSFDEVKPDVWQAKTAVTVEIEGEDKPALVCDWMSYVMVAPH